MFRTSCRRCANWQSSKITRTPLQFTEDILRKQGFRRSPPDFYCLVAEESGILTGLLVYYFVAFTYRAKPNMVVKEFYVADGHRNKGVGKLLMKAVAQEAERAGRGMIKWWVAKWNERGIEFYERLGAKIDPDWHEFQMSEEALRAPSRTSATVICTAYLCIPTSKPR